MISPASLPGDRVRKPTGLPAYRWRRLRSRLPRPATRISTGRLIVRRSSPTRSRSVGCLSQPDEVIAAGLLHDVLEKTATTSLELERRFGARIARLVESVSDDPSIADYETRKRELAPASRARPRTRSRFSPLTRSPRSGSSRCCDRRAVTKPRPMPSSPITARASRCSAELPGVALSSHFSTPSSTVSFARAVAGTDIASSRPRSPARSSGLIVVGRAPKGPPDGFGLTGSVLACRRTRRGHR